MKNFQHQHIIGLLGVCLDNDPHFIILELMEGGDLLSYLRASRASSVSGKYEEISKRNVLSVCGCAAILYYCLCDYDKK